MRAALFWLLVFGLIPLASHATAPSGEDWLTLSTPNFRVHHPPALEKFARSFGASLERALPLLEKDLRWKAPTPIDIVAIDSSDAANGMAINFPNTHIEVFAVPFESDSVLTHYVNWADELATHELTHIIANDSSTGFYEPLRWLFGSLVKPNGLQPVWLIEGLAVFEETSHTPGGRGRSPLMEALLRQAINEGKLSSPDYTSIDRLNSGNQWWPGGSAPYLMGYASQGLAERKIPGLAGELSISNSGRLPFFPDANLGKYLDLNWSELWRSGSETLAPYFLPIPDPSKPCFLTQSGRYTGGQALSVDGWIYFTEEDFQHGVNLARVQADAPCGSANVERLYLKWQGGPSQVAVKEDGSLVAFSTFENQRFERNFADLWIFDTRTKKSTQLTNGSRARDPAFDGNFVYYVSQRLDSSQSIVRRDLISGEEKEIFAGRPLERIAGLSARAGKLVFSFHNNKGHEKLRSMDLATLEEPIQLLSDSEMREYERNPQLLADGRVLYAHGTNSRQEIRIFEKGESKILAYGPAGYLDRPIQLPNGELLVQAYTLGGLNLARIPLNEDLLEQPYPVGDLHEFITKQKAVPVDAPEKVEENFAPSVPYNAASTPATSLWPQYWLPEASVAPEGILLGASTSGNDPLEYHNYGLIAQYDSRASFPVYQAYYLNRVSTTRFQFRAAQSNSYFSSSKQSNRNASYSASATIPLGGYSSFGIGASFTERTLFGLPSRSGQIYSTISAAWNGARPGSLETNFGYLFFNYLAVYPNVRNEELFAEIRPQASVFFPGFLPSHAVGLHLRAGFSGNRYLSTNYFQGGGLSILNDSFFVVRGYPVDALLGQKIATVNASYSLPLGYPYRGLDTAPFFLSSWGLRFNADAGTANYLARFESGDFLTYQKQRVGTNVIAGFGADLLAKGNVFNHIPVTASLGLHYGPMRDFGGDLRVFLGLNIGLSGRFSETKARGFE